MSARLMRGSRAPRGLLHLDAEHGVRWHGGDRSAQLSAGDVGGTVDVRQRWDNDNLNRIYGSDPTPDL
jgi:hypothetical protein